MGNNKPIPNNNIQNSIPQTVTSNKLQSNDKIIPKTKNNTNIIDQNTSKN